MHAERIAQYQRVSTPGCTIPVALTPFPVKNPTPEEEEVDWVVLFLQQNRSRVPYEMREDHLQSCMQSKTSEELSDPDQWGEVVGTI